MKSPTIMRNPQRKPPDTILLAHGSGGLLSHQLIEDVFLPFFRNPALELMEDSSPVEGSSSRILMTTDSYVVDPLFFPGGDIGKLAVCGTVNDLAVSGARPAALTAGFIIEEGLSVATLREVLASMQAAAAEAGVRIVAGDTKVVPRGKADKLFINTAGIGFAMVDALLGARQVRPGDAVLINGPIGDHGVAVMAAREGLRLSSDIRSDCAPLAGLIRILLESGLPVHAMRDPTRGGLATTLNEIALASALLIEVEEDLIPIRPGVRGACEIFGFEPVYLANEGKVLIFLPETDADAALALLQRHPLGAEARRIGRVHEPAGRPGVRLHTGIGGSRILDMLVGEQLPRIC
jgi:hydrogenase expression/formation protein HypE